MVASATQELLAAQFSATPSVHEGEPRRVILDAAAEWHPDVIVMGSHGKRGIDRFLLGSVSEGVVRHAPCSVNVVRAPQP